MSVDEPALMRAIFDFPEENTPRLMYADWLQENGFDARAEYIRLAIELDGIPMSPEYMRVSRLMKELIDTHGVRLIFTDNYPYFSDKWNPVVRRGFVEAYTMHLDDYDTFHTELFALHPITRIELPNRYPYKWPRAWQPHQHADKYFWNLDIRSFSNLGQAHSLPIQLSEILACDEACLVAAVGGVFFRDSRSATAAAARALAEYARREERESRTARVTQEV